MSDPCQGSGRVKSDRLRSGRVGSSQVRTRRGGGVESGRVRSSLVGSGRVVSNWIGSGRVGSGRVGSGRVELDQVGRGWQRIGSDLTCRIRPCQTLVIGPGGVGWFGPDHVGSILECYVMVSGKTLSCSLMSSCRDHSEIGLLKGGIKSNA